MKNGTIRLLFFAMLVGVLAFALMGCGEADTTTTTAAPAEETTTTEGDADTDGTEAPGADEFEGLEPIKLTYASYVAEATYPSVQMERWAEEINKRTNGVVSVDTFAGGTLLDLRAMWDGILQGVADMGVGATAYDEGRFPLTAGVALPHDFLNSRHGALTIYDLYTEGWLDEDYKDFKVITMWTGDPSYIMTAKPVTSLDTVKGVKLAAAGAAIPVVEALSGAPVGMPMSEQPEAVATGAIDGIISDRELLMDLGMWDTLKYVADYPTSQVTMAVVMNWDVWNSLPEPVQKVIDAMGREWAFEVGKYHDVDNVHVALDKYPEHNVQITPLDEGQIEQWDAKLQPLIEKWIEKVAAKGIDGKAFMTRLEEIRDKNAAQAEKTEYAE